MQSDTFYKINAPLVIFEVFDSETFIVDYGTGHYFSLGEIGTWIWCAFAERPVCLNDLYERAEQLGAFEAEDKKGVESFFHDLIKHELIRKCSNMEKNEENKARRQTIERPKENKKGDWRWNDLKLNIFTDMKTLIRLDPVHEIDGHGWPKMDAL